jgi:hypothetical protein
MLGNLTPEQEIIFRANQQHICAEFIKILGFFLLENQGG